MRQFDLIYDLSDYCELGPDEDVLASIRKIREFSMTISFQKLMQNWDEPMRRALVLALYSATAKAMETAKFLNFTAIEVRDSASDVTLSHSDDQNHFRIEISTDRMRVTRRGSSLAQFHEWYSAFVPTMSTIWTSVKHVLDSRLGIDLPPLAIDYNFKLLLENLRDSDTTSTPTRNTAVVAKVLPHFPNYAGPHYDDPNSIQARTVALDTAAEELGRMDIKFSRRVLIGPSDQERVWWYTIEAPANQQWSTLWFDFSYVARNESSNNANRVDLAFEEWAQAYEVFFIDSCLRGLVRRLLEGLEFDTTS